MLLLTGLAFDEASGDKIRVGVYDNRAIAIARGHRSPLALRQWMRETLARRVRNQPALGGSAPERTPGSTSRNAMP